MFSICALLLFLNLFGNGAVSLCTRWADLSTELGRVELESRC